MTPNEAASTAKQQFAVNWNNHMSHVRRAFDALLMNNELTDVTLYAEGRKIGAHRVLLSACSAYFGGLFREFPQDRPVVVLKGVSFGVLTDILKFIYNGEVSIESETFDTFLQAAEFLQISGLTEGRSREDGDEEDNGAEGLQGKAQMESPKRKKVKRGPRNVHEKVPRKKEDDSKVTDSQDNGLIPVYENGNKDTIPFLNEEIGELTEEINIKLEKEEQYDTIMDPSPQEDDRLKCPICFKVFSHPYSLHHHKPVHSGGTQCPICHVVLSRKYNLKMHMRSRHNVDP